MTAQRLDSDSMTIRRLNGEDAGTLRRLAQLDSGAPPTGAVLGAHVEGELVAAIALDSGAIVADPFRPSAEAVELLRLRRGQLGRARRSWLRRRRSRGALPGSPPGAGGRLLELRGA